MGPNDVISLFGPRSVLLAPVSSFSGGVAVGGIREVVVGVEIWWWWYQREEGGRKGEAASIVVVVVMRKK